MAAILPFLHSTVGPRNTGPVTVILDTLTDDRFGDLNGQGSCSVPQQIDPGQVYTCAFNAFPSGAARSSHFNVVTGSGTGGGQPVSDTDTAVVFIIDTLRAGIGYLVWNDLNADGIKDENEGLVIQPYHTDGSGKEPRYYQVEAINQTIEAVARGDKRVLLVMATGTGKTYTTFQIIWRLWKAKAVKRILFLADRNTVVDASTEQELRNSGID